MTEREIDALASRMAPIVKSLLRERDLKITRLEEKVASLEREVFQKNGGGAGAKAIANSLRQELAAVR